MGDIEDIFRKYNVGMPDSSIGTDDDSSSNNNNNNNNNNNRYRKVTVVNEPHPDPVYSFVPPVYFHELDNSAKEFEDLIDGIPNDIGTKNLKLIIKAAFALGRFIARSNYLSHLNTLHHARYAELMSTIFAREFILGKERMAGIDRVIEKLDKIPTRGELSATIAEQVSQLGDALNTRPSIDDRHLKAAAKLVETSDQFLEKVIDQTSTNLAQLTASRLENIKEDPFKRKLFESMSNMLDLVFVNMKLPAIAKKQGESINELYSTSNK